jgi:peptide/nickel transport system permease protein
MAQPVDARVAQDSKSSSPDLAGASSSSPTALRDLTAMRRQRSLWGDAWRQFRRHRLAMAGLIIISFMVVVTFVGNALYPRDYAEPDFSISYISPSLQYPFGTDDLGRDILARALWGGRISLAVGFLAALVAVSVGTIVGAIAGFFGGYSDSVLMRVTDMFISLPALSLLLLISFLYKDDIWRYFDQRFGSGNAGVFLLIVGVIAILNWMSTARLVRASFLSLKEKEFVEAARSLGASQLALMFKHILPNVLSPIIVAATLSVGAAIITESALSFLGLGFASDVPTWGQMLYYATTYFQFYPYMAIVPGMLIFLTVLAINYVGDGLRDALDPRKSR